ncbi:hypothetical protein H5232_11110 [Pseudoalteromonas sp. SG41-5]|uniref:hypothetical protein n=1 Tax=Pseudoalteromonas sp. SG41-5 TaxID=2760975 RepID=UPI001601C84A|nr:hypothetical protein [Pseudoalteromonas sp. SG41-5]MBB1468998.1 hypothetical protein [Pseudoalteromonas sp. SG41-5]
MIKSLRRCSIKYIATAAILFLVILSTVYILNYKIQPKATEINLSHDPLNVINRTILKFNDGTYPFTEQVTWSGEFIPIESYALIDFKNLSDEFLNGFVLYWLHRLKFASHEEVSLIKKSFKIATSNFNNQTPHSEFLDCSLSGNCNYKKLIMKHENSVWVPLWVMLSEIEFLKSQSDELNNLQLSSVKELKFFKFRQEAGKPEIVPPAVADYLITLPFYLNCESNNHKLLMYLYEVKSRFHQLSKVTDEYMLLASNNNCA